MSKTIEEKRAEMAKKKVDKKVEVERFPTGSAVLDCILSEGRGTVGGYPIKVMTLNSESKAGKSRLALEVIYEALKHYGKDNVEILYLDSEAGMSINPSVYGYTLTQGKTIKVIKTVEEMQVIISKFCKNKDPKKIGIVIVDSIDALGSAGSLSNLETRTKDYDKNGEIAAVKSYNMDKPKLLSEMMPLMTSEAEATNTYVLMIQQLRDNVGAGLFEKKTKVSGGKTIPYYTSVTFDLRRSSIFGEKDRETGYLLEILGSKTRTKYERRLAYIAVSHESGFDAVKSDLIFLYDLVNDKKQFDEPKSRALKWESEWDVTTVGQPVASVTSEQYKEFVEELELKEDIIEKYGRFTVGNIKKYVYETPEIFKKFVLRFNVMDLDTLCLYIEENDLEEELARRVKDKFFTIEEALVPKGRKSKALT